MTQKIIVESEGKTYELTPVDIKTVLVGTEVAYLIRSISEQRLVRRTVVAQGPKNSCLQSEEGVLMLTAHSACIYTTIREVPKKEYRLVYSDGIVVGDMRSPWSTSKEFPGSICKGRVGYLVKQGDTITYEPITQAKDPF